MTALPTDQAAELRLLMASRAAMDSSPRARLRRRSARVVAVASGKGGVGKTSIAVNLSLALSSAGHRVILVDADLGTANVDLLLNIHPDRDLSSLLHGRSTLDGVLTRVNDRLHLAAGASGLSAMADLGSDDRDRIIQQLATLEHRCDIMVVDCGAGISRNVLAFAQAADDLIVVATPEPTAVTDAYALIKVLARAGPMPTVHLVMNQAASEAEGRQSADRLTAAARKFLNVRVSDMGQIPRDEHVGRAVRMRCPLMTQFPRSPAATRISALASKVALPAVGPEESAGFFRRLIRLFH